MRFPRAIFLLLLAGCSVVQPHYAGDARYSCGKPLSPADYCTNFRATEALKQDPNAQRARIHCLAFYGEAVRATELVCSYFEEMDSLTEHGEGQESSFITAKGKRIHRHYEAAAQEELRLMERAYSAWGGKGARGAVEELNYEGRESVQAEIDCKQEQGHAPGILLLGLAAQARHDELLTFEKLKDSLTLLAGATSLKPALPYLALKEKMGIDTMEDPYARARGELVGEKLAPQELVAVGLRVAPHGPGLDRYYADTMKKLGPEPDTATQVREVSSGRGLASVRCPGQGGP
jgi:hypothetical protein